jgi:hypothetical protein
MRATIRIAFCLIDRSSANAREAVASADKARKPLRETMPVISYKHFSFHVSRAMSIRYSVCA